MRTRVHPLCPGPHPPADLKNSPLAGFVLSTLSTLTLIPPGLSTSCNCNHGHERGMDASPVECAVRRDAAMYNGLADMSNFMPQACDKVFEYGVCGMCRRLNIQCLGIHEDRYPWMRVSGYLARRSGCLSFIKHLTPYLFLSLGHGASEKFDG